jgi:hypothetical protein
MKKTNGGAIATIGSTRIAFTHVTNEGPQWGAGLLNREFFKAYENKIKLSDMFLKAQNNYLNIHRNDCITIEEFILLGDPSLLIGGY